MTQMFSWVDQTTTSPSQVSDPLNPTRSLGWIEWLFAAFCDGDTTAMASPSTVLDSEATAASVAVLYFTEIGNAGNGLSN